MRHFRKAAFIVAASLIGWAGPGHAQTVPTIDIRTPPAPQAYEPLRDGAGGAVAAPQTVPQALTGQPQIPQSLMQTPISGLPSIADLVERVSQSTVNIIVTTATGEMLSEGQGSGFIISADREVVTNYHVIEGGETIEVEFNDGRRFPARILGTDEETDLALLTFDAAGAFPHVAFHRGAPTRIGDWVVAIGNPFGIGQSTSLGVISAIGRTRVDSGSFVDYIQTDATINRGNSGGPLFNLDGEVVGVNSAIYSPTGASVGIAFVIPHETAETVVTAIRRDGRVRRGYMGAGLRDAVFEMDGRPGIFKSGAMVNNLVPGSPAEVYGLKIDDIILRIDDAPVRNSVEATRAIGKLAPGDVATIIYERDKKTYEVQVAIGERPEKADVERAAALSRGLPPPAPKAAPHAKVNIDTGVHVLDISEEFRTAIGMRANQTGVYVESVDPGSEAEAAGFKIGQVLLAAEAAPIADADAWRSIVLNAKLAKKGGLRIRLRRKEGGEATLNLPL
ncbi:trypsin-like peptidase domain-containing protein [uncultured Algimonas sp.]|uniref:trypsin-like peptidase domain-containing protein n=1 Tax=uncultured Algimonas sp. TaxID=1547920 RepID=UPI0026282438|nr:trypsin-like peptidase domain-containing protein [uncultured Algimonas sp.]